MGRKKISARLDRLDQLIGLLKTNDHHLIPELAKKLNVSPRTLIRDLDVLREKGYPIETNQGRGGGIRLHRHWGLGRLHLNYREVIDLLLSLAIMEKIGSPLFLQNLKSIRNKIATSFPQEQRNKVQTIRKRILIGESNTNSHSIQLHPPTNTYSNALYEAFFEKRTVHITYKDAASNLTKREIEPHYIFLCWPIWYILAWDYLRDDVRCFRLDRIHKAHIGEASFKLKSSKQLVGDLEKFAASL